MPPNLDLNRRRTSPLANICPPSWLDMVHGLAGLLEPDGKWYAISHTWDDVFGRANQPAWRREALLGKTLYELFPDDSQRQMFRKLLASMSEGKLEQHAQVVEFGSGAKALHVQLDIRPLWEEGTLIGFIVQGSDVTREHLNRLALLDRDRRMRELQTVIEEQKQRLEAVITRGRERDEKLSRMQEQIENQATERTTDSAQKTLEHSKEVKALHKQLERLNESREQELARLNDEQQRQLLAVNEAQVKRLHEFGDLVTKMTTLMHGNPHDFSTGLCQLFKEHSNCYFASLYAHVPKAHELWLNAQHNAPEFFQSAIRHDVVHLAEGEAPCGITADRGELTKFDHLQENEAYLPWVHIAKENNYNCLWAIPLQSGDDFYGILQLYYQEADVDLTADQQLLYTALAEAAVPLLRAADEWKPQTVETTIHSNGNENAAAKSRPYPVSDSHDDHVFRQITAELAEEYGNLLTGVLGHSTLAAAEIGDSHAAVEDIHAIERAARTAAKLTRKLSAIAGAGKRTGIVELGAYVQHYVKRNPGSCAAETELTLPVIPCEVRADAAAMDVIFEGLTEYMRELDPDSPPMWTLLIAESGAQLTLLCDGTIPKRSHSNLLVAREAARLLHGDVETNAKDGHVAVTLTLPVTEKAEMPKN